MATIDLIDSPDRGNHGGVDLQKAANLAQIVALIPGFYCGYGTYVLLHSAQQGKATAPTEPSMLNTTGLLWSLAIFLGLLAVGFVLRIIAWGRSPRRQPKKSDSSLSPFYGEETGFRIESAMFGAPGIVPEPVTSKVKRWFEKGNASVPVSWQLLLDGRDPKPHAYKYLTVTFSLTEVEGKELAIPVPGGTRQVPGDCVLPTQWKELTLQKSWYAPAKPESTEVYRDKVGFIITNAGKKVEVWSPLWESPDVANQPPLKSLLRREGPKGWRSEDWEEQERACLELNPGQSFIGWIGLLASHGEGLHVRINKQTTGHLVFPMKIEGTLTYERVPI
jgi:hypothetical protein